MASGVVVSQECLAEYGNMKMNKAYRYVVFKLSEDLKEIVVAEKGARDSTYEDFVGVLSAAAQQGDCRYAAYDVEFMFKGAKKEKLIFIAWAPEGAKLKQKMVYTSSKSALKKKLQIDLEQQATDLDELAFDAVVERCSRAMKD